MAAAAEHQERAIRQAGSLGSQVLDEAVDEGTREEEEKRWLSAPLSREEIVERWGKLWIPVPRFAVIQKGKPRMIDDY